MEMQPQKVIFCDIDSDPHIYRDLMIGANGWVTNAIEDVGAPEGVDIKAYSYATIEDFGRQIGTKIARHYAEDDRPLKLQVNFDVNFGMSESFEPFYEVLEWLQAWMTKHPDLEVYLTSSTGFLEKDEVMYDKESVDRQMTKLSLAKLESGLEKWSDERYERGNAEKMAHETKRHFGNEFFIHWRSGFGFQSMFEKILSS